MKEINEMDAILDAIHDDVLITDGNGVVLRVSPAFENVYGISKEDAIGSTVYELEKRGVFKPSIVAMALKTGEKVTKRQRNKMNRDIVVTATPVKDQNGKISKVISFSRDITEFLHLQEELEELRKHNTNMGDIVAKSVSAKEIMHTINKIAKFDANVLLTGESGVGKTMFAKLIHKKSWRNEGPFIEINCGAIPENLLESELFGYEGGSFTGANKEGKVGLIELAEKGTLFLDEISELPLNLQVKILKVIQDKKITRVGGTKENQVDFRLIAASNKSFETLIKVQLFREDLYYRLNVISIEIPPLREGKDDIIHMAIYFLEKFNKQYGLNRKVAASVYRILEVHPWPGNIRELENLMERLVLTAEGDLIEEEQLPLERMGLHGKSESHSSKDTLQESLEFIEGKIIREAYATYKTTVGVAKALGISQPTAVRKIKKYCEK